MEFPYIILVFDSVMRYTVTFLFGQTEIKTDFRGLRYMENRFE